MNTERIYKVEYSDSELHFLSEYTFEATSDFEAWYMTDKILEWYHGDFLELYRQDIVTREFFEVKQEQKKKAISNTPAKVS